MAYKKVFSRLDTNGFEYRADNGWRIMKPYKKPEDIAIVITNSEKEIHISKGFPYTVTYIDEFYQESFSDALGAYFNKPEPQFRSIKDYLMLCTLVFDINEVSKLLKTTEGKYLTVSNVYGEDPNTIYVCTCKDDIAFEEWLKENKYIPEG